MANKPGSIDAKQSHCYNIDMGSSDRVLTVAGVLVSIGGGSMSAFAPSMFPQFAAIGFWGGFAVLALGIGLIIVGLVATYKKAHVMSDKEKPPVIGLDIVGGKSREPALEILSNGTPGSPSIGWENIVHGLPNQSVIGTRVVQNGPGVGMRVVQNGPGIGFRSTVIIGKPEGDK
jgi:hypothetical protein